MAPTRPKDVDEYVAGFPDDVRRRLQRIRATIRKAAPGADESISYGIPAFKRNGPLIYFAAFKAHIGLYPLTAAVKKKLGKELSPYEGAGAKATARFPHDRPVPHALISRVVKLRVQENLGRSRARGKKK